MNEQVNEFKAVEGDELWNAMELSNLEFQALLDRTIDATASYRRIVTGDTTPAAHWPTR